MEAALKPNQAFLLTYLDYDPDTGKLSFKPRSGKGHRLNGREAGHLRKDGYIHVQILGKSHYAHCVIWCMVTGEWPTLEIDHADLNRSNNKWSNLREATSSQNAFARGNSNLDRGVEVIPSGYRARIGVRRKKIHLGVFKTKEEAREAVAQAANLYFGEFSRFQ